MRTRREVEEGYTSRIGGYKEDTRVLLEILLDIRELLASPGLQKDFGKVQDELSKSN